jgi:hypothetical protein
MHVAERAGHEKKKHDVFGIQSISNLPILVSTVTATRAVTECPHP